jgi:hypothetical protein
MLPTGWLLFMASAVKCYYLTAFWLKMTSLLLAFAFTFGVRRKVALASGPTSGAWPKVVAAVSLALWSCVAVAGRYVGLP